MGQMYLVTAAPPIEGVATVIDRHDDHCPYGCKQHKHERVDVPPGEVFDGDHLEPNTNVDALVYAGIIQPVQDDPPPATPPTAAASGRSKPGAGGQGG